MDSTSSQPLTSSSQVLTSPPSKPTSSTTRQNQPIPPPPPPARRTYGRAKPTEDNLVPAPPIVTSKPTPPPTQSSSINSESENENEQEITGDTSNPTTYSWKRQLAIQQDEESDDEVDDEAVRKFMEQERRVREGEQTSESTKQPIAALLETPNHPLPQPSSTASSPLTTLPPSSQSLSKRVLLNNSSSTDMEIDEERAPIKKPTTQQSSKKRVYLSSSSDGDSSEDEQGVADRPISIQDDSIDMDEDISSLPPSSPHRILPPPTKKPRFSNSTSSPPTTKPGLDHLFSSDNDTTPKPLEKKQPTPITPSSEDEDIGRRFSSKEKGKGKVGITRVEEDIVMEDIEERPHSVKGLNKKEMKQMEQFQNQIRIAQPLKPVIYHSEVANLQQFAALAASKVQKVQKPLSQHIDPLSNPPTLIPNTSSTIYSTNIQTTPNDDITAFSSASRPSQPTRSAQDSSPSEFRSNGPTKHVRIQLDDDDEEEELPDIEELAERKMIKEREEKLLARKTELLRRQQLQPIIKPPPRMMKSHDEVEDDDDSDGFEVIGAPTIKPKPTSTSAPQQLLKLHEDRTQIRVLEKQRPTINSAIRVLQNVAGLGVKSSRPSTTGPSDTTLRNAGETFNPILKAQNNTRSERTGNHTHSKQVTVEERDGLMLSRYHQQVLEETRRKEKESGMKARPIPAKEYFIPPTLDNYLDTSEAMEVDDDPEDTDYRPDNKVESVVEEEEEEDLVYSGEDEDDEEESELEGDSEKENEPPVGSIENQDKENEDIVISRRRKVKAILDSDDEEERAVVKPATQEDLDMDMDGGFSQFFGATQAGTPSQSQAFANMRHQEAPMFINNVLPDIEISASAIARDAALMEEDMDAEVDALNVPQSTAPRYVNAEGFFTQTRPITPARPTNATPGSSYVYSPELELEPTFKSLRQPAIDPDEETPPTPLQPTLITALPSTTPLPTPTPHVQSAYDILLASKGQPKPPKRSGPKGAFLDEQAEESDEDNPFGRRSDDEDEGGDDDGELAGLIDATEMTAEQKEIEEKLAREKRREIQAQDDSSLQKIHEDAVAGKFRGRHDGVDDLELSDDEFGRPSRKKSKKRGRKVEGDDLENLGKEADAFVQEYNKGIDSSSESDDEAVVAEPEPEVRRASSPGIRTETISEFAIQQRMRAVAAENRLRQQEAEEKFSADRKKPILLSDDDSIQDSDDERSFVLARNKKTPAKLKSKPVVEDKRTKRILDSESQNQGDSRRSGGISSVNQSARSNSGSSTSSKSTFRGMSGDKPGTVRQPARKQSSLTSTVMRKSGGFN